MQRQVGFPASVLRPRRRLLGWLALWPFVVCTAAKGQGRPMRIGYAWVAGPNAVQPYQDSFVSGLKDHGFEVGKNLVLDVRHCHGDVSRLPEAVDELIAGKPDLLVGIEQVARVMKSKTATIPIIVSIGSDPVAAGLAQSLARPGGNVTGMSQLAEMIAPKLVELIVVALPRSRSITMFIDPSVPSANEIKRNVRAAAAAKGVDIAFLEITDLAALDSAFERLRRSPPDALLAASGSGMLFGHRQLIAERALQLKIPVAGQVEAQAVAGFLFSYGADLHALQRDAAAIAARVLRGASPTSLPFQQATRFELVLNLTTAAALGIELPREVLLRADRTI